ncbi:MAG: aminotransferase class V-fold PLP-dependent enzyme, partial [Candidatus Limiplasma sp.]|nr:aminotransferase class V-fold PLP-dependent enzyme [Candidatus Limiplasma sp.]
MLVYLDNAATTKPFEEAVSAVAACMLECYWNPSSPYAPAIKAERELALARQAVAQSVGASEKEVLLTSGGTESDNLAIIGHMAGQRKDGVILYTAAEHPAVKNACLEAAALHGHLAREIPLTPDGSLDLTALEGMLEERVRLICVMQVCNETGVIMPLEKVVALRDRLAPQAAIHVDGVQGY